MNDSSNTSVRSVADTLDLGLNLTRYGYADGNNADNVLYCPAGLSFALGMLMPGMRGDTWKQTRDALSLRAANKDAASADYKALRTYLTAEQLGVKFGLHQGLWAAKGVDFVPKFLTTNADSFGSELRRVSFANPEFVLNNPTLGPTEGINPWVSRVTNKYIPKILEQLRPDDILVLVSAFFFEGAWTKKFPLRQTDLLDFQGVGKLAMMHEEQHNRYVETDTYQLIAKPFGPVNEEDEGPGRLHKVVLVPKGKNTLASVLKGLKAADVWKLIHVQPTYGHFYYPRNEVASFQDLVAATQALGMVLPFGGGDFKDLASGNIVISQIKQRNFARYHEEGGEGGSATAVVATRECMQVTPKPKYTFNANRPYFELLVDFGSGATFFAGVTSQPKTFELPKKATASAPASRNVPGRVPTGRRVSKDSSGS